MTDSPNRDYRYLHTKKTGSIYIYICESNDIRKNKIVKYNICSYVITMTHFNINT